MQWSLKSKKDLWKSNWCISKRKGVQSLHRDGRKPLPIGKSEKNLLDLLRKICQDSSSLDKLCKLLDKVVGRVKMQTDSSNRSEDGSGGYPWSIIVHKIGKRRNDGRIE